MFLNTKMKHFYIIACLLIFIDLAVYGGIIVSRSIVWDSSYYFSLFTFSTVFIFLLLFMYRFAKGSITNRDVFIVAHSKLDKFIIDFATKNNLLDGLPDSFDCIIIGKEGFTFTKHQDKLVVSFTTYDNLDLSIDKSFDYVSVLCAASLRKYCKKMKTK